MPIQSLEQVPLTRLKGVGPALAEKLGALGLHNIQDLLFHLPYRYEDRTRITPIGNIGFGDQVQLQGHISGCTVQFGNRRSLLCTIQDNTGAVGLRFFHFNNAQKNALQEGRLLRCFGEVRRGRTGLELYHPEYTLLGDESMEQVEDALTPVYPTTEGIQQGRLRRIIGQAITLLEQNGGITELLPAGLVEQFGLHNLSEALLLLHKPPLDGPLDWSSERLNPGHKRLAFEELLAHRLCMRRFKDDNGRFSAPQFPGKPAIAEGFLAHLPFALTNAQLQAASEIEGDLARSTPMLRLLQGDVGSGKTVVAALAALQAIAAGYQVALMAPTEILAEQHFTNFAGWFESLSLTCGWLTGKIKGTARKEVLHSLAHGECQLVVGTHALFQDDVQYQRLGLVIVDEQHRFGVHQRLSLREKAASANLQPHQLVMTATPIPRTLAMSAYADLDVTIISELPPGRTPVNTVVLGNERRDEVIGRIAGACNKGGQAYWVCTLIEESEALQCQAAEATAEQLATALPGIRVGLVHGRLKTEHKAAVMAAFKQGEIQLLVATTVIEVGVDVPNATMMVIENPERLGLSQLHQLRGRVGRGAKQSHCLLLYQAPLSQNGKKRLAIMRESTDGFYIAEKDLELRGPGQVLGTQQTGIMTFKVADIGRDAALLDAVKAAADQVLLDHPDCIDPLVQRWLGNRVDYAKV